MRKHILLMGVLLLAAGASFAQGVGAKGASAKSAGAKSASAKAAPLDSTLPIRGFCIGVPRPTGVDSFVTFVRKELAPRRINTLILRVDYHYTFKTHPELIDSFALSYEDAKRIVAVCKETGIRIVPQINLLGHQSDRNRLGKLLQAYPEFDETPQVQMPKVYVWPNSDNLYCKSYDPLNPRIHRILFDVIDEVCDVFEASAFHGGMDEVFYLGEPTCPYCSGRDPAELFAGEVWTIRDHLAEKGRDYWIWGDRLLDGRTTGLGMWEASYNRTYPAVDMIPKDVTICDWHYDRADYTGVYFAMKGFRVITCPWKKPDLAVAQIQDMVRFRHQSSPEMKGRFLGVAETVWSPAFVFLGGYYGPAPAPAHTPASASPAVTPGPIPAPGSPAETPWACLRAMFAEFSKLEQ